LPFSSARSTWLLALNFPPGDPVGGAASPLSRLITSPRVLSIEFCAIFLPAGRIVQVGCTFPTGRKCGGEARAEGGKTSPSPASPGTMVIWPFRVNVDGQEIRVATFRAPAICLEMAYVIEGPLFALRRSTASLNAFARGYPGRGNSSQISLIRGDINCSVDLRSTPAVGDRRYNRMRKHLCPSV